MKKPLKPLCDYPYCRKEATVNILNLTAHYERNYCYAHLQEYSKQNATPPEPLAQMENMEL